MVFVWLVLAELLVFLLFSLDFSGLDDVKEFSYKQRCFFCAAALPEYFDTPVEAPLFLDELFSLFVVTILFPIILWEGWRSALMHLADLKTTARDIGC